MRWFSGNLYVCYHQKVLFLTNRKECITKDIAINLIKKRRRDVANRVVQNTLLPSTFKEVGNSLDKVFHRSSIKYSKSALTYRRI